MTTVVLDTFTGTGPLASHVGEIGAVWSGCDGPLYGGSGLVAQYQVDNALRVQAYPNGPITPSGSAGIGDHVCTIKFIWSSSSPAPYTGYFTQDIDNGYALNWYLGDPIEIDPFVVVGGVQTYLGVYLLAPCAPDVEHTLTLTVSGGVHTLDLDGVTSITYSNSTFSSGYSWYAASGPNDPTAIGLTRYQIDVAGPAPSGPPIPPATEETLMLVRNGSGSAGAKSVALSMPTNPGRFGANFGPGSARPRGPANPHYILKSVDLRRRGSVK